MSVYTTSVRNICQSLSGKKNVTEAIEGARRNIFDFDYPLSTEHKEAFETKFLRHYYFREIGLETVQLWKEFLQDKLILLSPYYNQLYESADLKYDILNNVDYSVSTEYGSVVDSSGSSGTKSKFSDTPQGGLTGLENDRYLTNATISTDSNSHNTAKTGQDIQTIKGKEGSASYASLVREYREVIINIDQMLIADLSDLFMNVY